MRQNVPRRSPLLVAVAAIVFAAVPARATATSLEAVASDGTVVTATLYGAPIPPTTAYLHDCHTRDYPVVRCFNTEREVEADLEANPFPFGQVASRAAAAGVVYVTVYRDAGFAGSSLSFTVDVPDLRTVGWSDAISSFRSVNCGAPRFYVNVNYGGEYFQAGCNISYPTLGAYNDEFSSVMDT